MTRRLPPLNALRAFEASARHLSFTLAAKELHVTQGAVSRHIKLLEAHFGVPLFRRLHRGLELTERGRLLLPALSDAFDRIARAAMRVSEESRDLKLKVPPSFAIRWLIPRLPGFQTELPDVQVRLTTAWFSEVDFEREGFDACIDIGEGPWPGLAADFIASEHLMPVCAPALVGGDPPLRQPEDLVHHTLLHPTPDHHDWRAWLEVAGVAGVDPSGGQTFGSLDHAARAAAGGLGVAMGDSALIAEDLAAGRLVMPFDVVLTADSAYYFLCPEATAEEPKIAGFRRWLIAEAAKAGNSR